MLDSRRLDGGHARILEVLTGIDDDLSAAERCVGRILESEQKEDIALLWTEALVRYGRCFGKGLVPWGAREVVNSLPYLLRTRYRHFRRLRDTLISHPGGLDHTYGTKVVIGDDGSRRVQCEPISMFSLGRLEAIDFCELLVALQSLVARRRAGIRSNLHGRVCGMSDEVLRNLPK